MSVVSKQGEGVAAHVGGSSSNREPGPKGIWRVAEEGVLLVFAAVFALYLEWPLLSNPHAYQVDAAIHEWWMRRFRDPQLFNDPLTEAVIDAAWVPPGISSTYRLAANFIDPIAFAEWLPVVLVPLSVWLVFRIVRVQTSWIPAAWLGAVLFVLPWEIHRFSGGHSRAFMHPIVLLCVLLALRGKDAWAALVPGVGALFYPPAGIVALAIFGLSSLRLRPHPHVVKTRFLFAVAAAGLIALVLFVPRVAGSDPPQILTRAEVQDLPEFGPDGQLRFFKDTLLNQLRGNYSGFDLRESGSVLLAAAFLVVLTRLWVRPRLAPEVWAMAAGSLLMFAAAYAVLFHLYLPHRYTYPLVPFFAILVAGSWQPLWKAAAGWLENPALWLPVAVAAGLLVLYLGLVVSPLGPLWERATFVTWLGKKAGLFAIVAMIAGILAGAGGRIRSLSNTTAAGLVAGAVAAAIIVAGLAVLGPSRSKGFVCNRPFHRYLATVPKDSVIAAHPVASTCVILAARRPVVISKKLYQPWDRDFLEVVRPRMFDMLRAYYGDSVDHILELRAEYGADFFVVRGREVKVTQWRSRMEPFTGFVNRLLAENPHGPAALRLPKACITWSRGGTKIYDLACVESAVG